jgi:hypothetical protein
MVDIEGLVPAENLLRKVDKVVDFDRIYEMVEHFTVRTTDDRRLTL